MCDLFLKQCLKYNFGALRSIENEYIIIFEHISVNHLPYMEFTCHVYGC
jgi:hypothetical protein